MRVVSLVYSVYLRVFLVRPIAGFFAVLVVVALMRAYSELCIWSKLMVVSNWDWIDSVHIFKRIRRCRGFAIQDASGLC